VTKVTKGPLEKSRYQIELEALPPWAQKMVSALTRCGGYGTGSAEDWEDREGKYEKFHVLINSEKSDEWFGGFLEMKELAGALTAPWPKPVPTPHEELTTSNLVEMIHDYDDEEGGGFDQPCHYGNRCGYHAVYCHNDAWPDGPRKCRRNRTDYRHEECPGFYPNNLYKSEADQKSG